MKKILILFLFFYASMFYASGQYNAYQIYLITCDPGTESYSMYGHSALRVVDNRRNIDLVYNWGVFDFSTPNFNYKFAKGRLDYMLGVYTFKNFLQEYNFEQRSVYQQKVNLDDKQIIKLIELLNENAKPENKYYRYDFLKDNCATRIRDLIEASAGAKLIYPDETGNIPSYRQRLSEFLGAYPWLHMGIDLLIGTPGDEDCDFRGSMFLPDYLQSNLSDARLRSAAGLLPLLEPPVQVTVFQRPSMELKLFREAWFILTIVLLILTVFTVSVKRKIPHNIFDFSLVVILSLISLLLFFTNFFTDHEAMHFNLNSIWLNPLWLLALPAIISKKSFQWIWKTELALILLFLLLILLLNQSINAAFLPLILLVLLRCLYRLRVRRVN